jgi:hypothetical protein
LQSFAATDVDGVGVGGCKRDCADGAGGLIVEDGIPGAAGVVGLPDAAVVDADEEDVRLIGDARDADGPAAAEGTDHAPLERGVVFRTEVLGVDDREEADEGKDGSAHRLSGYHPRTKGHAGSW